MYWDTGSPDVQMRRSQFSGRNEIHLPYLSSDTQLEYNVLLKVEINATDIKNCSQYTEVSLKAQHPEHVGAEEKGRERISECQANKTQQ